MPAAWSRPRHATPRTLPAAGQPRPDRPAGRGPRLRRNGLAHPQGPAAAQERVALDEADRIVQALRGDHRVAADAAGYGSVGDAVAGDYLRWAQRRTRVDHAVTDARRPRLERGHHLVGCLG